MNELKMSDTNIQRDEQTRLGIVETEVKGVKNELSQMWVSLKNIENLVGKSRETNWQTLFAGALVVGALWAAAINPINADVQRQEKSAATIAAAVVQQDKERAELQAEVVKLTVGLEFQKQNLADLREHGSLNTDKRLTVMESELKNIIDHTTVK